MCLSAGSTGNERNKVLHVDDGRALNGGDIRIEVEDRTVVILLLEIQGVTWARLNTIDVRCGWKKYAGLNRKWRRSTCI